MSPDPRPTAGSPSPCHPSRGLGNIQQSCHLYSFATTTTRQRNTVELQGLEKSIKVSMSKWSIHNEYTVDAREISVNPPEEIV